MKPTTRRCLNQRFRFALCLLRWWGRGWGLGLVASLNRRLPDYLWAIGCRYRRLLIRAGRLLCLCGPRSTGWRGAASWIGDNKKLTTTGNRLRKETQRQAGGVEPLKEQARLGKRRPMSGAHQVKVKIHHT